MDEVEAFLAHFGIKGQKWRVLGAVISDPEQSDRFHSKGVEFLSSERGRGVLGIRISKSSSSMLTNPKMDLSRRRGEAIVSSFLKPADSET